MRMLHALAVGLALGASTAGFSAQTALPQSVTADGLRIEYGLVPASTVRAHPENHEESRMHEGPPAGRHAVHLVVALFDARSATRIENAKVVASVGPLGMDGAFRRLEPMQTGGVTSYGGYFHLGTPGLYRIRFVIKRPGWRDPITAHADRRIESDASR